MAAIKIDKIDMGLISFGLIYIIYLYVVLSIYLKKNF